MHSSTLKPIIFLLIYNNNFSKCCYWNKDMKFKEKTDDFLLKYDNNTFFAGDTNLKFKEIEYNEVLNDFKDIIDKETKITETEKTTEGKDKNGFKVRKINWKNINKIIDLEWDIDITELKRQIDFLEKISYIYELYYFLMMLTYNNTIFQLTANGAGGSLYYPSSFLNQKITNLLKNKNREKNYTSILKEYSLVNKKTNKSLKKLLINNPYIYDYENKKIFTYNSLAYALINGVKINFENSNIFQNKKIDYLNFISICEYLAQLGNPIFAICDESEKDVAIINNCLYQINEVFNGQLPFLIDKNFVKLDILQGSGNKITYKDEDQCYKKIKELGAVKEQDMILLAEVIVLNNILYDLFKFAEYKNVELSGVLTFSSYGGKVFELLMSLIKNEYKNLPEGCTDENKYVFIAKNKVNTLFLHGLLGANELYKNNADIININYNKLVSTIGSFAVSKDRLQCFNIRKLFKNSFKDIIKYYHDYVNDSPLLQIISKFRKNNESEPLINAFRFQLDDIVSSLYKSKFYDGLLSDDALFIYNNDEINKNIKDLIRLNIDSPLKDNNMFTIRDNKLTKDDTKLYLKTKNNKGLFIINDLDNNIKYIHVGGGSHMGNEKKINNETIYDGRGLLLEEVLNKLYTKN